MSYENYENPSGIPEALTWISLRAKLFASKRLYVSQKKEKRRRKLCNRVRTAFRTRKHSKLFVLHFGLDKNK